MEHTTNQKSYVFRVVVEPDNGQWHAYCPLLEEQGASTWGESEDKALKNLREVLEMVVDSMQEHGEEIPKEPQDEVMVLSGPSVAVTV